MLCSRALLRPLAAVWAGCPTVGAAAWAALPTSRPLSSAIAGAPADDANEQHHQEEVAEEEAEEWALGQREDQEHEGFEALPWPLLPAADPPTGGARHNSSTAQNGSANNGVRPVRFYSGQAGGGGDTAAGGEAEGAAPAVPAWERAEVLWEAEEPRPGSWRQGGGEERDPFQGEEVNPHSKDPMSESAREKMLSEEESRIANETGP